jgi:hypothetical protein
MSSDISVRVSPVVEGLAEFDANVADGLVLVLRAATD